MKFRPESPLLEDYVVIPCDGHDAAEDCFTTGQLASIGALTVLILAVVDLICVNQQFVLFFLNFHLLLFGKFVFVFTHFVFNLNK